MKERFIQHAQHHCKKRCGIHGDALKIAKTWTKCSLACICISSTPWVILSSFGAYEWLHRSFLCTQFLSKPYYGGAEDKGEALKVLPPTWGSKAGDLARRQLCDAGMLAMQGRGLPWIMPCATRTSPIAPYMSIMSKIWWRYC